MATFLTLGQMAEELDMDASTLRRQVLKGRLRATKLGHQWIVTRQERDRYEVETRGQRRGGRPKKKGASR